LAVARIKDLPFAAAQQGAYILNCHVTGI
jgi:hypothetical protein